MHASSAALLGRNRINLAPDMPWMLLGREGSVTAVSAAAQGRGARRQHAGGRLHFKLNVYILSAKANTYNFIPHQTACAASQGPLDGWGRWLRGVVAAIAALKHCSIQTPSCVFLASGKRSGAFNLSAAGATSTPRAAANDSGGACIHRDEINRALWRSMA